MTASIEQIGSTALHLVGDVERDSLNGGGRIDAAEVAKTLPSTNPLPKQEGAHFRCRSHFIMLQYRVKAA